LQQLLDEALHETKTACRWTAGIAKAQEQLAQALVLPVLEHNDDADDDLSIDDDMVMGVVKDDGLPEKLKDTNGGEQDDETAAAAFPSSTVITEELLPPNTATAETSTSPPKNKPERVGRSLSRKASCNDGSQPPVFSISFPNPEAAEEAVYVLHKQHDLLQQTLSRAVSHAVVDKIQELKVVTAEQIKKLDDIATNTLKAMQRTEQEVQKAWGTYTMVVVVCVVMEYCAFDSRDFAYLAYSLFRVIME
jgi:hypothetical protein